MSEETTYDEATNVDISDLTPRSKRVNVTAKVLKIDEAKEIPSRYGSPNRVAEATIGDTSGAVVLSLWNDQIGTVEEGETVTIENGYVSLVRGHIRLNAGKYGRIVPSENELEDVNEENNISDAEHEDQRRGGGGGGRSGGGGGGRGGRGGGGGGYGGGGGGYGGGRF
jgi:replication factor A1